MPSRTDLHHYQERAIEFITDTQRCALFLEMGLGKTVSTLTAIADLSDGMVVNKALVIAPLRVANSVWKQEARKWDHLRGLKVSVCTGDSRSRAAALMRTADVYVINRENVPWLVEHLGDRWDFDFVVVDESSSFKNPTSKRFKALRRVLTKVNYMLLLTGTPSPNGLLDLWSQVYLIDSGKRLGKTFTAYKQRFFVAKDYMGYKLVPKSGADSDIHSLLSDSVLSMRAEDYLELPERISLHERLSLPAAIMLDYLSFEKTLLAQLPDGETVEAMTAAVLAGKLLQWCSGAMYTDDKKNWSEIHNVKLDALEELIEQTEGENLLVAYNYNTDLARLRKRFPTAEVLTDSQDVIDRWNRGEIELLLAHPQSAGHGLNLQDGGNVVVWFSLCWSLEYYQQFNARLHRQGQGKPVRIIHLVIEGCIDETVVGVLAMKDATQEKLLNALRIKLQEDENKC